MRGRRKPVPDTVMPAQCRTCIFRSDGNQVRLRDGRLGEIMSYLVKGTTHLCHSAVKGGDMACRGGRDWQLEIWFRLGILPEPTDDALAARMVGLGLEPPPTREERHGTGTQG